MVSLSITSSETVSLAATPPLAQTQRFCNPMSILVECPACHNKQSIKRRLCSCGEDLVKAKKAQRVCYWIDYRVPGGKQRREKIGYSVEEAKAAEGKRRAQKHENPRVLEKVPDEKTTFKELADWYLNLTSVKKLRSYERVKDCLSNFNDTFGETIIAHLKPVDIEEYQEKRSDQKAAPATIDMEISIAKTLINKALDNEKVSAHALKAFRGIKRRLKKGGNARERLLSTEEYLKLLKTAPKHLKPILVVAYNTGMRKGEILGLRWPHIDRAHGFIRLPSEMTKEGKPKAIPMNHHVVQILDSVTRAIHHDYVFSFRGKPIAMGLRRSFQGACKDAGIPYGMKVEDGVRFHDIRGTVKTNMLRAGVDKVFRDIILGHSLKDMDAYYLKPSEDDLRKAMEKYTVWLDGQLDSAIVDQNVDQGTKKG